MFNIGVDMIYGQTRKKIKQTWNLKMNFNMRSTFARSTWPTGHLTVHSIIIDSRYEKHWIHLESLQTAKNEFKQKVNVWPSMLVRTRWTKKKI